MGPFLTAGSPGDQPEPPGSWDEEELDPGLDRSLGNIGRSPGSIHMSWRVPQKEIVKQVWMDPKAVQNRRRQENRASGSRVPLNGPRNDLEKGEKDRYARRIVK